MLERLLDAQQPVFQCCLKLEIQTVEKVTVRKIKVVFILVVLRRERKRAGTHFRTRSTFGAAVINNSS